MDSLLNVVAAPHLKKNVPQVKPGQTVRVHQVVKEGSKERIQIFEGVVIACKGGRGVSATFAVRKISYGIGVERTFPLHSPRIVKVEQIKTSQVRRAKLYYLRGLTGKAARLNNEKQERIIWEEKGADKQIEQIEEAVAEEAEARAEEKMEQEGELKNEENTAQADEVKADIATGESDAVIEEAKETAETPEEVAQNDASGEVKAE